MTVDLNKKKAGRVRIKKSIHGKSRSNTLIQEGAQSVHRTISLIRTVADYDGRGGRLSQIARKTGLPISTVHRILSVLVSEGFVEYDPMSKHYHLGIELYTLGNRARKFTIRNKYHGSLEHIAQETGNSAWLVLRSGFDALCIDLVQGKFPIRIMAYDVGARRPIGVGGAASLSLLAFSTDDEIKTILEANKNHHKAHNHLAEANLQRLIKDYRKSGYAFSQGTFLKGVNGVGVPIYNEEGKVIAAISVGAIAGWLDHDRAKKIADLIKSEIDSVALTSD